MKHIVIHIMNAEFLADFESEVLIITPPCPREHQVKKLCLSGFIFLLSNVSRIVRAKIFKNSGKFLTLKNMVTKISYF